jgi:hypothetical protein
MYKYNLTLDIGLMDIKYIETPDDDWIDDEEELLEFDFTQLFGSDDKAQFCNDSISLLLEGDLDDPEIFSKIKAVGVSGPKHIVEDSILTLSDVCFYFDIESETELDEENFEDLIHLIEPVIESKGYTIAYGDFSDWSAGLEDMPSDTKPLNIEWAR